MNDATPASGHIESHDGLLTVTRRVEITGTATGPVELLAGTLVVHGCVDGDIAVEGGHLIVLGRVTGRVTNNSGSVEVSGAVGDLRGPPAYTRVLPGATVGDHVIGTEPGAIESWAIGLAEIDRAAHELHRLHDNDASANVAAAPSTKWVRPAADHPAPKDPPRQDRVTKDRVTKDRVTKKRVEMVPEVETVGATEVSDGIDQAELALPPQDVEVTAEERPLRTHEHAAPSSWTLAEPAHDAAPAQLPREDLTDESLVMRVNQSRMRHNRQLAIQIGSAVLLLLLLVVLFVV